MPATLVAGLPNITGSLESATMRYLWANTGHGVLSSSFNNGHYSDTGAQEKNSAYPDIKFDASRSNSIYGSSTTVQPPAIILLPQIKYQGGDISATLQAGLPNIVGRIKGFYAHGSEYEGAMYFTDEMDIPGTAGSNSGVRRTIHLDAQLLNNIYGNSNTVQPSAIVLFPQIKY